jgi:hypothetical protein
MKKKTMLKPSMGFNCSIINNSSILISGNNLMTECTISCFHNCYYTDINNSRRPTINFLLSQLYIIMKCSFQSWIPIYIYMMLTYQEIFHKEFMIQMGSRELSLFLEITINFKHLKNMNKTFKFSLFNIILLLLKYFVFKISFQLFYAKWIHIEKIE